MDYAHVPTGAARNDGIETARKFFASGAGAPVTVPPKGDVKSVLEWIDLQLPTGDAIGTTYLVSHASNAHLGFPMTSAGGSSTTYEKLVDLLGAVPRFIAPASFRTTPGPTVFIKGCRIGVNEAFLRLLKQHLGGTATVKAPQHFNAFFGSQDKTQDVVLDFLMYNLELHRAAPITTHAGLVQAFVEEGFKRYDRTPIPAADLKALLGQLPQTAKLVKTYLPGPTSTKEVKWPLRAKVLVHEPIAGQTTLASNEFAQFRSEREVAVVKGLNQQDFDTKTVPEHVEDAIKEWDRKYKNATPVPVSFSERIGLRADEDPVDIEWTSFAATDKTTGAKGRKIAGIYYRYQLLVPVTSVVDGSLLFGSAVARGPALATPVTWPADPAHLAALFRTV